MVSDVKIDNVGGSRPQLGVASEATLQALLEATRGTGRSERDRLKLQENYDRSIKDTTQSQGSFKRAITSGTDAVGRFAKELAFGEDRATDFANAVFGSTSMVTQLTRYLDENIDTWRSLSSVGASFNNSILDMISSAANSAMNFDSFASMVRNNSEALSRFGSTTTQGAKFIGEFSKNFRSGVGVQFLEMGFTIEDVNEGLIGFMALERQRSTAALRSDRAQQEAAAQYLLSLDKLTKITGRQRKQIEDALAQQMQDAGIRSQINRLEGQARTNLQETLAFLDTELQGPLADGLKDLMDGVAQTDLGKALQSQVPGISEFARQMFEGGATVDEVISQLGTNFGPQLARLSGSFTKAQLDQMRMSGGVAGAIAEILDSSYQLNQIVSKDAEEARREQERREPLTAALGKFENAIILLRKHFVDAFFDIINVNDGLVKAFSDLGDYLMSWVEPGANSLTGFVPTIRGWIDTIFGPTGFVTRGVRAFTKYLREGGLQKALDNVKEAFDSVKSWVTQFINDVKTEGFFPTIQARFIDLIKEVKTQWQNIFSDTGDGTGWKDRIVNYVKDILFGKEVEVREGPEIYLERQGGLIKTITDGFRNLLTGDNQIVKSISDGFKAVFKIAESALLGMLGVNEGQTLKQWFDTTFNNISTRFDEIMATVNETFETFKTAIGFGDGKSLTEWFDETWASVKDTMTEISTSITSAVDLIRQAFDISKGESLGSWIDKTLAKLTEWKDNQIASLRALIGMEGTESFGDFVLRLSQEIQDKIEKQIEETLDLVDAQLRSLIGMGADDDLATFFQKLIADILGTGGRSINDWMLGLIDTVENKLNNILISIEIMMNRIISSIEISLGRTLSNIPLLGDAGAAIQTTGEVRGAEARIAGATPKDISLIGSEIATQITELEMQAEQHRRGAFGRWLTGEEYTPEGQQYIDRANALKAPLEKRIIGTLRATGQASEPRDTVAQIHQGERVLNPQETAEYNRRGNQSDLSDKLDQLNTTMSRVAFLLEASVGVQTRTMQNIKGLSTDIIKGIPR